MERGRHIFSSFLGIGFGSDFGRHLDSIWASFWSLLTDFGTLLALLVDFGTLLAPFWTLLASTLR